MLKTVRSEDASARSFKPTASRLPIAFESSSHRLISLPPQKITRASCVTRSQRIRPGSSNAFRNWTLLSRLLRCRTISRVSSKSHLALSNRLICPSSFPKSRVATQPSKFQKKKHKRSCLSQSTRNHNE